MIRSLRSLPFFRPPKAILVPGTNFLGFSRYLNCRGKSINTPLPLSTWNCESYQSVLVPGNAGTLVGIGVGVALDGTGLTAEQTVELGADLVATIGLDGVALSAAGL